MKLLVIFAHADDAEIWAGGTLIKHHRAGDETWSATFPDGDAQRMAEAQAASQVLGVELRFLEGSIQNRDLQCQRNIQRLLEEICPEIVVTHWSNDTHAHHRFVFDSVNEAIIPIRIATGRPRVLYVCDTYHSVGLTGLFQPHHFLDVSDVWEQKLQAIDAYSSQSPAMWKEMITNQARLHGARIGRPYAEAFMEIPILGRFRPGDRLLF
jgi:N-acetylglucosamine malate deacetylase 1